MSVSKLVPSILAVSTRDNGLTPSQSSSTEPCCHKSDERDVLGAGPVVEVRVGGCTYGPHTRSFGVEFLLFLRDERLRRSQQHVATFILGRGGNNSRERGVFQVELPNTFASESVIEQVIFLEKAAKRAGINLGYTKRPPILETSDVYQMFFFKHRMGW
ncbi:MAG: hypothetical protein WBD25_10215 [Terriglobales bacterium]|jgi:hypothetical protein